jgi:hypothetical protein
MKKMLFIFSLILFSSVVTYAQGNAKPSKEVMQKVEILKAANLQLSEVQLGRITTVLMGEESNEMRIRKALEGNKSQLELRLIEHKQHVINNLKGAMTPYQVELFEKQQLENKF